MNDGIVLKNGESRPEVDDLLRDFFRAEMPHPWPACQMPLPLSARRVGSFWSRYTGRVALAASITLLVGGYLMLAAYFPPQPTPSALEREVGDIAHKEKKLRSNPSPVPSTPPTAQEGGEDVLPPMFRTNRPDGKSGRSK